MPLAGIGIGILILGIFLLSRLSDGQLAPLREQNSFLEGQLTALRTQIASLEEQRNTAPPIQQTVPACDSYSGEVESLQRLIVQGQFVSAAQLANLDLTNRKLPPCPEAKITLATLAYNAALDDLFATGGLDGRTALMRWQDAEQKADDYQVPKPSRWPAITVVNQAYNSGFWELGRAAFLKAWTEGAVDRQDLNQIRLYYAVLRNYGYALVNQPDGPSRESGLALLRTADEISRAYALNQGEARQDLGAALGPDVKTWPPADASDPVLAITQKDGGH